MLQTKLKTTSSKVKAKERVRTLANSQVRKEEGIQRKIWAKRIQFALQYYEKLFHPELFIIGGQLSKKAEKIFPYIKISTKLKAAVLQNNASIVGAALSAVVVAGCCPRGIHGGSAPHFAHPCSRGG